MPAISGGVDIITNPKRGAIVIRFEGIVSENRYTSSFGNPFSFDQISFKLVPQMLYNFYNTADLKFYADAGIVVDFLKYDKAAYQYNDASTGISSTIDPGGFNGLNTFVLLRAGAKFGSKWGIFADYQSPGNLTNNPYFSGSFTTIQLGFNYYFN